MSIENASVDRIISRIDQTPILEVKQRLKQHLDETRLQKNRLKTIITQLGGKPTKSKADLLRSNQPTANSMRKNFSITTRSNAEGNYQENSVSEEGELVK